VFQILHRRTIATTGEAEDFLEAIEAYLAPRSFFGAELRLAGVFVTGARAGASLRATDTASACDNELQRAASRLEQAHN
jgi:hypothetical protein